MEKEQYEILKPITIVRLVKEGISSPAFSIEEMHCFQRHLGLLIIDVVKNSIHVIRTTTELTRIEDYDFWDWVKDDSKRLTWLEKHGFISKRELPKCPYCKESTLRIGVAPLRGDIFYLYCHNSKCQARGPRRNTKKEAIEAFCK